MNLVSKLAPNWLTNIKVIDLGHVHTIPDRLSECPENRIR